MSELTLLRVNEINYTKKGTGEQSPRSIIPTFIPDENIKAVDVTNLPLQEQQTVVDLLSDYAAYVNTHMAKMFSFEDWLDHTSNLDKISEPVKWRTFSRSNID